MSSDTVRSSILWTLGLHLLLLLLFARFLNSRRNTRRQMNVDLVTDKGDIWMITIGREGTKSYASYTPDFRGVACTENTAVKIVENYPNPPDGERHHLGTIDADQRDMDRLRDAILQSSPVICSSPAHAFLKLWNIFYKQGHLNEKTFKAGKETWALCVMESLQGN